MNLGMRVSFVRVQCDLELTNKYHCSRRLSMVSSVTVLFLDLIVIVPEKTVFCPPVPFILSSLTLVMMPSAFGLNRSYAFWKWIARLAVLVSWTSPPACCNLLFCVHQLITTTRAFETVDNGALGTGVVLDGCILKRPRPWPRPRPAPLRLCVLCVVDYTSCITIIETPEELFLLLS